MLLKIEVVKNHMRNEVEKDFITKKRRGIVRKLISSKYTIIFIGFIIIVLFLFYNDRDIEYVLGNVDDFDVNTTPYNNEIEFTLQASDLLKKLDKPRELETIYNTDVYLWKISEVENTLNDEKKINILIGLDSHYKAPRGKMLSITTISKKNSNITYSLSTELEVQNDKGDFVNIGKGYGDSSGRFEQHALFVFPKEEINNSKEWSFKISGLHLLEYNEN